MIAAINHAGVAMGRISLIKDRLQSGELIAPFPESQVVCKQKYYVATLPERHSQKVKLFIEWLEMQAKS